MSPGATAGRLRGMHLLLLSAAVLLLALITVGGLLLSERQNTGPTPVKIGGPFQLTDSSGQAVTERSWPGKYLLIYFGYTYCPDVCPTTLNDVSLALNALGAKANEVQPLFITVDPHRDTPQALASYTGLFSKRLVGLTGTDAQIAAVAHEYHVYYARQQTGPGPDDYTMDHSSVIYLVAPDGHFLSLISTEQDAAAMAASIARRLS